MNSLTSISIWRPCPAVDEVRNGKLYTNRDLRGSDDKIHGAQWSNEEASPKVGDEPSTQMAGWVRKIAIKHLGKKC